MTGTTVSKFVATTGAMGGFNSYFNRVKKEHSKSHNGIEPTFRGQQIASGMFGGIATSPAFFAYGETRSALQKFPRAPSNWELVRNHIRTNPNLGGRYITHAGKSMWQGTALGVAATAAQSIWNRKGH